MAFLNATNSSADAQLKTMVLWTIGRIASREVGSRVKRVLLQGLKDSSWKVRAAACTAISNFGS